MAAAAPSSLASSVEWTNYVKLMRLLFDGGKTVLKKIFDRFYPPSNLLANLNANYHTLNNLQTLRVLSKSEWDLLFPPDGATTDSETFDITLLFLLLINICGLSPPRSGWHSKPDPSDTSLEANIVRVWYFRDMLAHIPTARVDTPTFNTLWHEISAVLVSLGFDQAEIDRLKTDGYEYGTDVELDWADSQEKIKSELEEIRQIQVAGLQTILEVHKTHKTQLKYLEDVKSKLDSEYQFAFIGHDWLAILNSHIYNLVFQRL